MYCRQARGGGGDTAAETKARSAIFRFRVIWLNDTAIGQVGAEANLGTGQLPKGLTRVTDINDLQRLRIEALKEAVVFGRKIYEAGIGNASNFLEAQNGIGFCRNSKPQISNRNDWRTGERRLTLRYKIGSDVNGLCEAGAAGGNTASETKARADVFRFRVMWWKETAIRQGGEEANLGTGQLPKGLAGVTNVKELRVLRIEALKDAMEATRLRYEHGLDNIDFLLELQMELVSAQLETTDDKQERLDYIREAFNAALRTWQRCVVLREAEAFGGDTASETKARAAVFRFRVMWLKEKATGESAVRQVNP